jgi:hypothetical protein
MVFGHLGNGLRAARRVGRTGEDGAKVQNEVGGHGDKLSMGCFFGNNILKIVIKNSERYR